MRLRLLSILVILTTLIGGASEQPLPIDPAIRMGTLPNGLTYYIRHNAEPKGRAECWLVHKVGSINENDNEQGWMHFLEHMAFNGTKHFTKQSMIDYLTANGMTYGGDINASTSFDETVYHISNVPTTRHELLDSVLLFMQDLSGSLTLDIDAIEKEKGIVEEEWRSRNDFILRLYEQALPTLLGDCRYAHRIPIGKMDLVKSITREQLLPFYHKWFRPDLQAVILVGDFDPDKLENKLKNVFSSIPARKDRPTTTDDSVDTTGIKCFVYNDEESTNAMVHLYFPYEKTPRDKRNTLSFLRENTCHRLLATMFNQRLNEIAQSPESSMQYASCSSGNLMVANSAGAFNLMGLSKTGQVTATLQTLLTEARRVQEHGFNESELIRAREMQITLLNNLLAEKDKHNSADYVSEYIDHFINGSYIPGVEYECELTTQALNEMTLNEVNQAAQQLLNFNNIRALVTRATGEPLPDQETIKQFINQASTAKTTAYIDTPVSDAPLMESLPTRGHIIKEEYDADWDMTILTLSNGTKVQLKHTTFKNDEVLLNASSTGGCWVYGGKYDKELRLMNDVVENSALGIWNQAELKKRLSTTPISLVYTISDDADDINGKCRNNDLTNLLQLNYLYFTSVHPDNDAYQTLKSQLTSQIEQITGNPDATFSDSIAATLYQHHPLYRTLTVNDINNTDFGQVIKLYHERVASAANYTFTIVGNYDSTSIRPLIEQYIASIPSNNSNSTINYSNPYPSGDIDNVFLTPMQSPKASVYACLMGDMDYNLKNVTLVDMAGQVMQVALTSFLREELHGTYGVDAGGGMSKLSGKWMINAKFDTQPDRTQSMVQALAQAFDYILSYGTTPELLEIIKGQMLRQHETNLNSNEYWLNVLRSRSQGLDMLTGYQEMLSNLSSDDLNKFITSLEPSMRIRVIMQGYKK